MPTYVTGGFNDEGDSAVISGVSEGQLVLVFAGRGHTDPDDIEVPAGWTPGPFIESTSGGIDTGLRIGWRYVPAGGLTDTGVWTNATHICWIATTAAFIGALTYYTDNVHDEQIIYPALALTTGATNPMTVAIGIRATVSIDILDVWPPGHTLRQHSRISEADLDSTAHMAVYTDASGENFPGWTQNVGVANASRIGVMIELTENEVCGPIINGFDAATLALYESGVYDTHSKFTVENGDGTPIDLTADGRVTRIVHDYPNPQQPIASLTAEFTRENTREDNTTSLSPTITVSSYNKLDDNTTYSPLLQIGRICRLYVALTAVGAARPANDSCLWYEIFQGPITLVDWPEFESRKAMIKANDLGGILQTTKTETPFTYASGTSIEDVVREILDDNGFDWVSVMFLQASNAVIPTDFAPGLQKTVWSLMWDAAQSLGWVVFFQYQGPNTLNLTFIEPARDKTTPDKTINNWWDFTGLTITDEEIRNVGYVQYFDEDGVQQLEGPEENTTSIAKYGGSRLIRRTFWIALTIDSPIRSQSEANALLLAALSDVSEADMIATVDTVPLVFAKPCTDLYRFGAKYRFWDNAQDLALFNHRLTIEPDEVWSSSGVRGVPSAGRQTWELPVPEIDPTIAISVVKYHWETFYLISTPSGSMLHILLTPNEKCQSVHIQWRAENTSTVVDYDLDITETTDHVLEDGTGNPYIFGLIVGGAARPAVSITPYNALGGASGVGTKGPTVSFSSYQVDENSVGTMLHSTDPDYEPDLRHEMRMWKGAVFPTKAKNGDLLLYRP